MIFDITPHAKDKRYGKALNEQIACMPEDTWVVVRDRDTMYLRSDCVLEEAITDNPGVELFTCATNRAFGQRMLTHSDILWHWKEAQRRAEKKEYTKVSGVLPAFFWMFPRTLWQRYPFDDHPIIHDRKSFDTRWCNDLGEIPKIRIEHLYVFHFYRLQKHHKDFNHLL